ncbi:MAG: SRPBCC domain-containing protein [Cyclobacteriaceae bacterium]
METTTIKQERIFSTVPEEFYGAFMSSEIHSRITGSDAKIENKVGGAFQAYEGYCFGESVELIPGKRIVQTWCAYDDKWVEGHFSKIMLKLSGDSGKTKLMFIHEDVPIGAAESIADGWDEYYWKPFEAYFESK